MKEVMIVGATRTPIGSFRGSLSSLSAVELGAVAVRQLLKNSNLLEEQVDELIFGQVLTAGCGQNPARQTAIASGLPVSTPATPVAHEPVPQASVTAAPRSQTRIFRLPSGRTLTNSVLTRSGNSG